MQGESNGVALHYDRGDLMSRIANALASASLGSGKLTPEVLEPLDQLHVGGAEGTRSLARLVGVAEGMQVLDVGGGLGGPARLLAAEYGCRVIVLEPTQGLCDAGRFLSHRSGLADRVFFARGSGLAIPFRDGEFHLVWTQSVTVHVLDKTAFYAEANRVLRPGGRLALHELGTGEGGAPHFPVPWARSANEHHGVSPASLRAALRGTGLRELTWRDETAETAAWFRSRLQAAAAHRSGLPPIGMHLLFGAEFALMLRNQVRNFEEGLVRATTAVFEKVGEAALDISS